MYVAMLAFSVVLFAATAFIYLRHPAASVFHPATYYLLFHGLVFVLRPLFAWHYGYDLIYGLIGFSPSAAEKVQALICTNLAFVAFMAVALRVARQPLAFPEEAADRTSREALLRRFWPLAIPLAALAAFALYRQWEIVAAARPFVLDEDTGFAALKGGNGYLIAMGMMLGPITAMLAYLAGFRWWTALPFLGFAILQLGTGYRGDVVNAGVMLVLLFMFSRRLKWPSLILMLAAAAMVPVFDALQADRGLSIREALRPDIVDNRWQGRFDDKPLETMDLASLEAVEFLVWAVPKRTGSYDYFVGNLQLLTEPVPRALWPGKPVGPPIRMFDLYKDTGTKALTIAHSVPGAGWSSAGYLGVALWSALFALIYSLAYRGFARSARGPLAAITYIIVLATAPLVFRDGSLLTLARLAAFYLLPVAALAIAMRLKRPIATRTA